MALSDWIPIVATIKHALADPKGRNVADYTCTMDKTACGTEFEAVTIKKCQDNIKMQMLQYIADFCGGGIVDQYAGGVVSLTLAAIVGLILKKLIAKNAAQAAISTAGGVTIVLAVDGFADLAITIRKINQIKDAAEKAMQTCCSCPK
ncbi:hypothetical protein QTN47_21525 [Danxiaibacter flavus]|uniref:Uncharacterized protein n=1 Tax=Danxiaibacter flavus TaxID=3049108 RepID=A0ABV3ZLX6_9BACT|nr:hypothetical protein QNM32_21530 [Chitinophagaceae bacterium DXS]